MAERGDEQRTRVELRRTGGIAGVELHSRLDTAELPEREARQLEALVADLPPPGAADRPGAPPPMPDVMRYQLSIQQGGRSRSLVYTDIDMPPEVRPLVQRLIAAAGRH